MKTPFEQVQNDEGSSFRLLHEKMSPHAFSWDYHYHPEYEMVFVFDGRGRRHVGNHISYYEDGDLVFMGSNLPHAGFGYDSIGEYEQVVIQFKYDFLGEQFFDRPEMAPVKKLLEMSQQGIQYYGKTFKTIGSRLKKLPAMNQFERLMELISIFHVLAKSTEYNLLNATGTRYDFNYKDQARLKKVYDYVEMHYQDHINIKDMADLANLTVPSFCNYFKKIMNHTFTEFLNDFRINKACQMLMTEKSVADVCFECGFTNSSYFSKVFKEIKGKSPLQFKNMVARKQI
ncbi:helix-turn-helix domain-containing protein [Emticicia sp. CRIBPO]|uniref:AraC family transcriptional regulator n=1 Tax=Emticicia sp. CRIBPO TaxID=2683258 RepID=UPI001412B774|nr:AraC family transcriptional regulator [Emticicia sp. CRIBPO]NBA87141.1 helix-turn-helix domain-containing protein [Emticicia sp. CRIBPO]